MRRTRHPLPCVLLLAALAAGCATASPDAGGGTLAAPDGLPIAYESRGAGDTAVVFVHCWACNRRFWRHQVEPVAAAGYRVVTLDLPGHGESGAEGREEWSVAGLGADVAAVVEALGVERAILVGHSLGGPVAVEAASRLPGRVAGIVCVDTLHDVEWEWPEGMAESIAGQLERDYRGGMLSFVPQLFLEGADPELVDWVMEQAVERSDPAATVPLILSSAAWDGPARLAAAGAPIRCINAAPIPGRGLPTAIETNRKHADYDAVFLDGVGHYPQLERPADFNRLLLDELAELAGR